MIRIRFSDESSKRRAIGFLLGRFSFESWATGAMLVSENALSSLALEGVLFTVEGLVIFEQLTEATVTSP
jgi:hypothetical protein